MIFAALMMPFFDAIIFFFAIVAAAAFDYFFFDFHAHIICLRHADARCAAARCRARE